MAWFFFLPWLEWLKKIENLDKYKLCAVETSYLCLLSSAEQTNGSWSPINCFSSFTSFLQLREKPLLQLCLMLKYYLALAVRPVYISVFERNIEPFYLNGFWGSFISNREWSMESVLLTPSQVTVTQSELEQQITA